MAGAWEGGHSPTSTPTLWDQTAGLQKSGPLLPLRGELTGGLRILGCCLPPTHSNLHVCVRLHLHTHPSHGLIDSQKALRHHQSGTLRGLVGTDIQP